MRNEHILIIGSGFAGLGLGIRLKQAGIEDFTILEQADDVGGTWRDNTYPGAACDVQSHLYCYSFEPNPNWSRSFAPQREILDYLRHCADKYDVRKHIRFGTQVLGAKFDEGAGLWELTTNHGSFRGRVLTFATGGLSRPSLPDIAGRDTFQGPAFHSARWEKGASFEGKTVGVIGTGASAIQIVPELARDAKRLVLFQRTAPWVLPKPDYPIPKEQRERLARSPFLQWFERASLYMRLEARLLAILKRPQLMSHAERMAIRFIEANISDPALRKKLVPNYRMGCKRILMSNEYYAALARPNVEVVTDGIDSISSRGIVGRDGREHAVDTIVYATGFQVSEAVAPFPIVGKNGVNLQEQWADGAEAYRGATVPGFPNLFFVGGPNTGLSHSSMIFMLESLMNYVVDAVQTMRREGIDQVSVKPEVAKQFNRELQSRFSGTVWASGCRSWYQAKNGNNVALWPGFTFDFRRMTRRFDLPNYEATRREPLGRGAADPRATKPAGAPRESAVTVASSS